MLTRHGWTAVVAALAAFAIGRTFGLVELYVLGGGLVAAVVVALVVVRRRLADVRVRRIVRPSTVAVGEQARVDIRVTNVDRRRTPAPAAVGARRRQRRGADAAGRSATPASRPARRTACRRSAVACCVAGPLRASRRDVLGLAGRTYAIAGSDDVLIVPQHVHLPFPDAGSAGRLGQHLRMKAWGQTRRRVPLAARVRARRRPAPDQLEGVGALRGPRRAGDLARGRAPLHRGARHVGDAVRRRRRSSGPCPRRRA